jgi:hypothetical protein
LFLAYLRKKANAPYAFGKGLGAFAFGNLADQKLKDIPPCGLLKIGGLNSTRWAFEGKPKRSTPAKMTAGGRAPAKQQPTPMAITGGNSVAEWSEDSETEEEEREAPNEEELEEPKMLKQAPAHPTGAKGRPFKGKAKGGKTRVNAQDPEWLAKNLKPSPFDKIAHHRGDPWYWCSPESGGKCNGCWRKHKPMECKGTAMLAARSTKAKSGDAEELKLLLLKALSVVMNENADME